MNLKKHCAQKTKETNTHNEDKSEKNQKLSNSLFKSTSFTKKEDKQRMKEYLFYLHRQNC